jgi:hypothetical protein
MIEIIINRILFAFKALQYARVQVKYRPTGGMQDRPYKSDPSNQFLERNYDGSSILF